MNTYEIGLEDINPVRVEADGYYWEGGNPSFYKITKEHIYKKYLLFTVEREKSSTEIIARFRKVIYVKQIF